MPTRLNIRVEGEVPGLSDHALSLSSFGPALRKLLRALRRIGASYIKDAASAESNRGRLPRPAAELDFEIGELRSNSPLEVLGSVVQRNAVVSPLFPDWNGFTDEVGDRFLRAVESEGAGKPEHSAVRAFLNAMPTGVSSQRYSLVKSTGESKVVELGLVKLPEVSTEAPYLKNLSGEVTGVGFEPGEAQVKIKTDGGTYSLKATDAQVERALELRKTQVEVSTVAKDGKLRLLHLRSASEPEPSRSWQEAEDHVFERWDAVLRRLAE